MFRDKEQYTRKKTWHKTQNNQSFSGLNNFPSLHSSRIHSLIKWHTCGLFPPHSSLKFFSILNVHFLSIFLFFVLFISFFFIFSIFYLVLFSFCSSSFIFNFLFYLMTFLVFILILFIFFQTLFFFNFPGYFYFIFRIFDFSLANLNALIPIRPDLVCTVSLR